MSLYHEAAEILTAAHQEGGGSLKSLVFGRKTWKTDGRILFALTAEAAKWSNVLSEVVEKSGVLKVERNLSPILALLLTHDLLLSKKGVALPATHGLHATISRHKNRLSAELTKLRIRRGLASVEELRVHVNAENHTSSSSFSSSSSSSVAWNNPDGIPPYRHPRWIRINTLKATLEDELSTTFAGHVRAGSLQDITHAVPGSRLVWVDEHVPNLLATVGPEDPSSFKSYKTGRFIFQEKASCFPAYLLDPKPGRGDVVDACAAPGNKTTHLASILAGSSTPSPSEAGESGVSSSSTTTKRKNRVTACEKDAERSKTLEKMVRLAGAEKNVLIKAKQDFLRIDPKKKDVADVVALLLDPSCSGSGIVGRDEASVTVHLPSATAEEAYPPHKGKKRKRGSKPSKPAEPEVAAPPVTIAEEEVPDEEVPDEEVKDDGSKLTLRLEKLSGFQLKILQHAMSFPAAQRITYSTCSVHAAENEHVVVKALLSEIALQRGWRILKRGDQVDGMRRWRKRGYAKDVREGVGIVESGARGKVGGKVDVEEVAEGCIRCDKGGEEGTMGFFVAGFVRDDEVMSSMIGRGDAEEEEEEVESGDDGDEFEGFSDGET